MDHNFKAAFVSQAFWHLKVKLWSFVSLVPLLSLGGLITIQQGPFTQYLL
jgi:hypothetical protein